MKKVVSFCLWGTNPYYLEGAIRALASARQHYKDWECWFYLAEDVPYVNSKQLEAEGATVIHMRRGGGNTGNSAKYQFQPTFWRFLPASDPNVEMLLIRDTDSPITLREVVAVEQWLGSGMDIHIMRDHPKHEYPMLAGMWGCRTYMLRDMKELIASWKRFDYYGCDQKFLGTVIYPKIRDRAWIQSECIRFPSETIHPFPSPRIDYEFIGISFTGDARVNREAVYLETWMNQGGVIEDRPLPWSLRGRLRQYWRIVCRRLGFN